MIAALTAIDGGVLPQPCEPDSLSLDKRWQDRQVCIPLHSTSIEDSDSFRICSRPARLLTIGLIRWDEARATSMLNIPIALALQLELPAVRPSTVRLFDAANDRWRLDRKPVRARHLQIHPRPDRPKADARRRPARPDPMPAGPADAPRPQAPRRRPRPRAQRRDR